MTRNWHHSALSRRNTALNLVTLLFPRALTCPGAIDDQILISIFRSQVSLFAFFRCRPEYHIRHEPAEVTRQRRLLNLPCSVKIPQPGHTAVCLSSNSSSSIEEKLGRERFAFGIPLLSLSVTHWIIHLIFNDIQEGESEGGRQFFSLFPSFLIIWYTQVRREREREKVAAFLLLLVVALIASCYASIFLYLSLFPRKREGHHPIGSFPASLLSSLLSLDDDRFLDT